MKVVNFRSKE